MCYTKIMKKFLILIAIILPLFMSDFVTEKAHANSQALEYAKILDDCLLYKTTDTDLVLSSNVYFTLPKGYFVTIITNITSDVIKVKYDSFIGFVKSDKIIKVSGTPTKPYLSGITFSIKENSSTQIRTSPTTEEHSNVIQIIPNSTTDITYIGQIVGEIPPSGSSNIWYFAAYSPASDPVSVYFGYVYSEKTENLSPIPENFEFTSELTNSTQTSSKNENYITLTGGVKTMLLIITAMPLLIIIVVLFLFSKRKNKVPFEYKTLSCKKLQNQSKKDENVPKFPTYEFDDDDLL